MKGRLWKNSLAAALALLVVSGNVPIRSVADLFGGAAITANAEEGEAAFGRCGENAFWSFDTATGKLTIFGRGDMYSGGWEDHKDEITSVEIENGITSIGEYAFRGCTNLTSIEIPGSVTSIGDYAFYNRTGLTSITIPDSVESIGVDAFLNCTNIKDVYCYADPDKLTWNENDCDDFMGAPKSRETVCHVPGAYYWQYVKKFGAESENPVNVTFDTDAPHGQCGDNAAWEFDLRSGKLTISGTEDMYDYTRNNYPWKDYMDNIISVEIKNGITSIGAYAFYNCQGLQTIKIPDSITSIGADAFSYCACLTSISIPDSVTSIGKDAFYLCTGITDVYCYADPKELTWIEDGCNDFKDDGSTVCHVPAENLSDYAELFGENVNVTFSGDMGLGEHLYGHSITLDGSIGVNFYVELTDELLASETAEMMFTVPNGSETDTQTLLVKDVIAEGSNKVVIGSKTYYKFKCSVSAKDMASEITAQLIDGEKTGTEYKYSVKDYANYLLAHTEVEEYANAAPLVKSMLNYGAASKRYFNEGTAIGEVRDMADVTVPNTFKYDDNAKLPEGVTFEGATLSLKSETTLSLYFKGLPAGTTFTCNGKTVETAKNGKYVVARIRGIKASELENSFTVKFKSGSMTYKAMTYCYNVLNGSSYDEKLEDVCRALYLFARAANDYIG